MVSAKYKRKMSKKIIRYKREENGKETPTPNTYTHIVTHEINPHALFDMLKPRFFWFSLLFVFDNGALHRHHRHHNAAQCIW